MTTLPVVQAQINYRDNDGNAFAAIAETKLDAIGDRVQAILRFDLQDNRYGWAEVYKLKANGQREGVARVEVNVPEGMQKPDDVALTVDGSKVRLALTAHQTSLAGGGTSPDAVVGRIITVASAEFPTLFAVRAPEPCGVNNLPYFRPNETVTRAQVAKMIALAVEYIGGIFPTPTQGAQTFEDVEVGSTFYVFVEKLAQAGVVGGYACTP